MSALLPAVERTDDLHALRALFETSGYTAEAVRLLLHTDNQLLTRSVDLPVHLRRLRGDESPLSALVKVFVLGVTMEQDRAEASLGAATLVLLERLQLLRDDDGGVRGEIRLVPHDDLVIASDRPGEGTGAAHVAAVHGPSVALANLTVRRRVERALDVGTGNGIQAILASRHAERVVATDVNARALTFARLNAALNGADNIEFREGSFLEPVAGERFGLVVANPPYVISPESEFMFRDSGLGGDRVSEQIVHDLPQHVEEGGFATVMISWVQSGDDETSRPTEWLGGQGCDAWIFHSRTEDPLSTAAMWNRDAKTPEEYGERIDRWTDYYLREKIPALAYGGVVLRRRTGAGNWVCATELPTDRLGQAGPQLERMFAAQDLVAEADDAMLLGCRFAFADGVAVEQELRPGTGTWNLDEVTLKLTEGIGFRAGLDEIAARVVLRLTPDVNLGECVDGVAAELKLDRDELRTAGADLARRLLTFGYLVPR